MRLPPEVAQAFANLRGNVDFGTILKWVAQNEAKAKDLCVKADGLSLYRAQGSASTCGEFLEAYQSAPDVLKQSSRKSPV